MSSYVQDISHNHVKSLYKHSRPLFWKLAHELGAMSETERVASIKTGFTVAWADAAKAEFQMSTQNKGALLNLRWEESSVGKECVRKCRSRWFTSRVKTEYR